MQGPRKDKAGACNDGLGVVTEQGKTGAKGDRGGGSGRRIRRSTKIQAAMEGISAHGVSACFNQRGDIKG